MEKTMYYLIYKITNQIDGKFYIGSHKTKNLDDNYMGSGKYLIRAQQKYGIENFKKEILFVFDTAEEMYAKEAEIVNEDFLSTENTYNLKVGGFGGWDYINNDELLRINKNKKARYLANVTIREKYNVDNVSQLQQVKEKLSIAGKKRYDSGFRLLGSFSGLKHSDKTKEQISQKNKIQQKGEKNSQYGKIWITNGTENKKINKTDLLPNGWKKGRILK